MSIKSKVLAAAGVVTPAGALSAVGTTVASAATPQCGSNLQHLIGNPASVPANQLWGATSGPSPERI